MGSCIHTELSLGPGIGVRRGTGTHRPDGFWAGEEVVYEPENRRYELILRDTSFDPSAAKEAAEALVLDEDVDILFGVTDNVGTVRVIEQVAKPTDTLYVTGGDSSARTLGDPDLCGRKVLRANEHTGMVARSMAKYVGEETDTETIYLLGVDTPFGRTSVALYRRYMEAKV